MINTIKPSTLKRLLLDESLKRIPSPSFKSNHLKPITSYLLPLTCYLLLITYYLLPITLSAAPFTTDLSWGEVTLTVAAEPETIDPAQDLLLTVTLTAPDYLKITLPDLRERFSGFSVAEDFAREPVATPE